MRAKKGNGAERHPFPVSSTAPHYRRTKSESQELSLAGFWVNLNCPLPRLSGTGSEGADGSGIALNGFSFRFALSLTEPRTGGRATGGEDYVAVGIETLDC